MLGVWEFGSLGVWEFVSLGVCEFRSLGVWTLVIVIGALFSCPLPLAPCPSESPLPLRKPLAPQKALAPKLFSYLLPLTSISPLSPYRWIRSRCVPVRRCSLF